MGQEPRQRLAENRLPPDVAKVTTPGRHADGKGLYLVVDDNGAWRWVFIYRWKANRVAKPCSQRRQNIVRQRSR